MCKKRSVPLSFKSLSQLFNDVEGYYYMGNEELENNLLRWNLLDEKNQKDVQTVYSFMKWSFTISFLEMINSWQWLLAGVTIANNVNLPAQMMQLYYYSIFFSSASILSALGKGRYTLKMDRIPNTHDFRKTRKEIWFEEDIPPYLCVKDISRGAEHEVRAKWFYEVFRQWDLKDEHQTVLMFEDDRTFHSSFRNMFTYELSEMAEELYTPDDMHNISLDILLKLWDRDEELADFFPEEFWAIEHIKASIDLHSKLIENYNNGSLHTGAQAQLIENLLKLHKKTGMDALIRKGLSPIMSKIGVD